MRWIMVPGIISFFDKYVDNNFSLRRRAGEPTKTFYSKETIKSSVCKSLASEH